jgi:TonB family protein
MNQIILLDYEPRTTVRVTEALTQLECEVVAAKDVDAAVAACAKVEPRMVLITSVLPHIKVEDAITQLRARAGLRNTPFLVMMSGYTGQDPQADALGLGAQDIVAKPFSNEDLLAHVKALLARPRQDATITADTRAEMIEALRRGSGKDTGMVTSEELFGDLLADEPTPSPAETQRIAVPPSAAASAKSAAKAAASASAADEAVARALDGTLSDLGLSTPKTARPRKERTDVSVDKLLEDTLSGLEVGARHGTATHPTATTPDTSAAEGAQLGPATAEPESGASAPGARGPAAPVAPLPGGTPFGQYELIEPIATGGMAEVYRARMRGVEGFQKIVAIKRILPHLTDNDEFVTMFVDEAKLAAQLQHPNIIHIYDLGKIERSYYIAMEYIDGKDLRSILRALDEKKSRLPLGLALFIASRLAAALDYAHRKKDLQGKAMALVHRDISPQNVLISFDGDIKLCDFGIAKATSKASHTRAGALKGKLQYMSPEQAWGRDIDHRSDIFSLGLVLYEMLTGRKGFAGDSELSILEQVRAPKLVPPREIDPAIPPEVERVVLKALKEDCEQRYQTAAEFASELGNILQVIRPAPGASELGSFLADLVGRERPISSTTAPAARPAIAPPPAAPAKPAPAPRIPVMEPVAEQAPEGPPPPRRRLAPIAAVAVGVLVVVAAVMLFSRAKRPATSPSAQATPAPETVEMAREAARQEVAKQTQAMQGRLAGEIPTPAAVAPTAPAVQRAAVPAAARPAVAPTQQPRQAPAAKASVPTPVPAQPSPVPTEAAAPAPAAVQPIEKPPTAVPATPAAAPTHAPLVAVQPTVKQGDLVEMGNGVVPPEPIYSPKPAYPPLAERQRIGGTVLLAVLVDENGSVQDIQVLRPITPDLGLTAAAVAAARTWRYKPATKNGVRVKVRITQAITFRF